ncbi:MAG: hypothetical protein KAQ64_00075 [Candidatus Pacebacteria bacterium]|nr:hypothetical protein [Candidatus Paceibacterota bacterium]
MCEGKKTGGCEDCCGDGSCGNGISPVKIDELQESVQKRKVEISQKCTGCKFNAAYGI